MRIALTVISILYLTVAVGLSQSVEIDNHAWQVIAQGNFQFRVPDSWQTDESSWIELNGLGTVTLLENIDLLDAIPTATIEFEEGITLPIGLATKSIAHNTELHILAYEISLSSINVTLLASMPINSSETEQTAFFAVIEQVANTLQFNQNEEGMWSLFANADATIFLRTPLSWSKEASNSDTLSVTRIFDDVLVSITYRDLGRPFELAEVEDQFETIYTSNSYDIQERELVNLPVGDALYFQLGNVLVTSALTHTQLHYVIARENYLIVVTAGADERYFDDYENTLQQMMDTIVFEAPH